MNETSIPFITQEEQQMQLKTVLNRCNKFKSFVYSDMRHKEENEEQIIEIDIKPRKNAKAICSDCHKPGPTYDTMREPRRFEFIPIWGILLFFVIG